MSFFCESRSLAAEPSGWEGEGQALTRYDASEHGSQKTYMGEALTLGEVLFRAILKAVVFGYYRSFFHEKSGCIGASALSALFAKTLRMMRFMIN